MEKILFLDLFTLQVYGWLLIGFITASFAFLDGFDLGIAGMMPFVAKSENEKRIMLNTLGPVWESNQVWLVLLGGTIFSVFPLLYAMAFSGFYLAMFLILVTLILRPVGFKFRAKIKHKKWRQMWDGCLCIGGILGPLLFGVAIGNLLLGTPFYFDEMRRGFYTGSFIGLLQPFAVLCGLCAIPMCIMQGALFLNLKTDNEFAERMRTIAMWSALATLAIFVLAGIFLSYGVVGYQLDRASGEVTTGIGFWLTNYEKVPALWLAPIFTGLSLLVCSSLVRRAVSELVCFGLGSLAVFGIILTCGITLFPFLMTSSLDPNASLTLINASNTRMGLFVFFLFSVIFVPTIVAYVSWVFYKTRGKIDTAYLLSEDSAY